VQKFWRSLQCFKACYKTLLAQREQPALVLLNVIFPAGIFVLWLYYIKKIPFIIQEQWSGYYPEDGNYKGFFTKKITAQCVTLAKMVLVVSDKLEKSMQHHGLHNQYKRVVNVVDTNLFMPQKKAIPPPFRFIHVSTVNDKEKNITGIIKAAQLLHHQKVDFIVDIIGDGPERAHFEEQAQQYQLKDKKIFFHGFRIPAQVSALMAHSHAFILNSNYEGLPCVLLEAMSCGIPVISTGVGAVPDIVNDKQGIIIPVNNEQALANAMQQIMHQYHTYDAKAIRQYIIDYFSYPAVSKVFDGLFTQALNS
jgi:glycosyltransferase involved in cell wall biosynthesis